MERVAHLLTDQLLAGTVGRRGELRRLDSLWDQRRPVVRFVWGLPGIGKSTLVQVWALKSRARGRVVALLDARDVDPTPEGFEAALARGFGRPSDALPGILGGSNPFVVVIDHFEALRPLEPWLRDRWLLGLGPMARVVLVTHSTCTTAWSTAPGWGDLVDVFSLGPLDRKAALDWLATWGLDAPTRQALYDATGGHPLALRLARGLPPHELARLDHGAPAHLLAELSRRFLDALADPSERELLTSASVVRRVTVPILRAILERDAVDQEYRTLGALPFVMLRDDGLHIHDTVRTALASTLRATEPSRYQRNRRAAFRAARAALAEATTGTIWRSTADLIYMIDNEAVRRSFFPGGIERTSVRRGRPGDLPRVRAIAAPHCHPRELEMLLAWTEHPPNALSLIHDGEGPPRAFYLAIPGTELPHALLGHDPLLAQWVHHARSRPGGVAASLFVRAIVDIESGGGLGPTHSAARLDVKRFYMELRPRLRHVYTATTTYGPAPEAAMRDLGFVVLDDVVAPPHCTLLTRSRWLDLGAGSIEGWLAGMLERELGEPGAELLDPRARELLLPEGRIPLTELEAGVLGALLDRSGQVVPKHTLLQEVWGHGTNAATSNVLQAVVSGLRKKLGPYAAGLITVRGRGYRFDGTVRG